MNNWTKKRKAARIRSKERIQFWKDVRKYNAQKAFEESFGISPFA